MVLKKMFENNLRILYSEVNWEKWNFHSPLKSMGNYIIVVDTYYKGSVWGVVFDSEAIKTMLENDCKGLICEVTAIPQY